MPASDRAVVEAFRVALDLFETGMDLMRQNLRRRFPDASDAQIDRLLEDWVRERPGAEFGDSAGRVVELEALKTRQR